MFAVGWVLVYRFNSVKQGLIFWVGLVLLILVCFYRNLELCLLTAEAFVGYFMVFIMFI